MATALTSSQGRVAPKRMFAAAKKNDTLELLIYDSIGESMWGGGVSAESVKQKLDEAGEVGKISVRINSPGGDVFEGSTIYSLLSQHKAKVECYVDGLAASAAFTIAMAADEIHISESAMMMCHNAWGMCMGNAADMEKMADTLGKVSSTMRDIYSKRCGMKADEVQTLMDAETWMTAEEAVESGFADDVIARDDPNEEEDAKALAASYDLSKFRKAPHAAAKDTSFQKKINDFQQALDAKYPSGSDGWPIGLYWAVEVFENNSIVAETNDNDKYFRVTYTVDANAKVVLGDALQPVEKTWVPTASGAARVAEMKAKKEKSKYATNPRASDEFCGCACAACKAENCKDCSNADCKDSNCGGHVDPGDEENSKALAEVELMREQLSILAI
jgi:ATP-dependent Clp endopeptidase proteolytic subunit ClpP